MEEGGNIAMEFVAGEDIHYTVDFLLQQVKEQSRMCDITVRMELWERKYHGCVLVASPFFDCILKNDFLEKRTGLVSLAIGNPECIDRALMHMYGVLPTFSDDTIEDMLHLAEFFLLPTLKSACVKWLNSNPVTLENCLYSFQLSRVYEFELPKCSHYIASHLCEIFANQNALSLTFEFIDYVFNEERFGYFQMKQRLQFLIRWYKTQPESRKYFTEKLLESIAFEEIPPSSMHAIKSDIAVEEILRGVGSELEDVKRDVLVYKHRLCNKLGAIYDIRRNMWFQLSHRDVYPSATRGRQQHAEYDIIGTNSDDSELYWTPSMFDFGTPGHKRLSKLNLDKNEIERYDIVHKNSGQDVKNANVCYFSDKLCVICTNSHDGGYVKFNWKHHTTKSTTLILIGKFVDQKVEMEPQFSISLSKVVSVTVNRGGVIAMLLASREHVLVYDPIECTLDTLKVEFGWDDKLCPTDNGFVIHGDLRCIIIVPVASRPDSFTRFESSVCSLANELEGGYNEGYKPSLRPKYKILPNPQSMGPYIYQYYFSNDTWYRLTTGYNTTPSFRCADHVAVVKAQFPDDVNWVDLRPFDKLHDSLETPTDMYHLKLSCRVPLCHLECPHCAENERVKSERPYVRGRQKRERTD